MCSHGRSIVLAPGATANIHTRCQNLAMCSTLFRRTQCRCHDYACKPCTTSMTAHSPPAITAMLHPLSGCPSHPLALPLPGGGPDGEASKGFYRNSVMYRFFTFPCFFARATASLAVADSQCSRCPFTGLIVPHHPICVVQDACTPGRLLLLLDCILCLRLTLELGLVDCVCISLLLQSPIHPPSQPAGSVWLSALPEFGAAQLRGCNMCSLVQSGRYKAVFCHQPQ